MNDTTQPAPAARAAGSFRGDRALSALLLGITNAIAVLIMIPTVPLVSIVLLTFPPAVGVFQATWPFAVAAALGLLGAMAGSALRMRFASRGRSQSLAAALGLAIVLVTPTAAFVILEMISQATPASPPVWP